MKYNKKQRQQLINKLEEITLQIETQKSILDKCDSELEVEFINLEIHLMEQTKQVIKNNIICDNWYYVEEIKIKL
jgi:hypothetical protein